mgnify:CR=1 FL=1
MRREKLFEYFLQWLLLCMKYQERGNAVDENKKIYCGRCFFKESDFYGYITGFLEFWIFNKGRYYNKGVGIK